MVSYVSYQSSEMIATNHMNLQLSSSNHFSIWPQMQPCKWSQLCHRFMSCHVCTNFDRSHSEAIVIMFHLKKRWFIFNASLVSRPVKQTNPLHVPRGNVGNNSWQEQTFPRKKSDTEWTSRRFSNHHRNSVKVPAIFRISFQALSPNLSTTKPRKITWMRPCMALERRKQMNSGQNFGFTWQSAFNELCRRL